MTGKIYIDGQEYPFQWPELLPEEDWTGPLWAADYLDYETPEPDWPPEPDLLR